MLLRQSTCIRGQDAAHVRGRTIGGALSLVRSTRRVSMPRAAVTAASTATEAAAAPKTGQHTADEQLYREALSHFFDMEKDAPTLTPTSGGVNNVVQYIDTAGGDRYVLRIYNNGNDTDKVHFEHCVLQALQQQRLSFKLPRALSSKRGRPHEPLSSGAECCVFEVIPGSLAKTTSPQEVGRATGELSMAMSKVHLDMKVPMPPYWNLFKAHHAMSRDGYYQEVATNPAFNVCREAIDFLTQVIRDMETKLGHYKSMGLPEQLIHGDLHYDNVMVLGDQVSGLLDFEFCTFDWRAMELAVALSKYVGESSPLPLCEEFVTGYVEHGRLVQKEIDIIPDLIILRILSNVVYFTGRAVAGEDGIESLTSRAPTYAKRVRWVNANREALKAAIASRMPQQ